ASSIFSSFPASFGYQTNVDSTSLLVRYTLYGDANLSGNVDLTDFTFLAANFNGTSKNWLQGDFNYDDKVDLTDFTFLASNFNKSLPGSSTAALGATVPEPASVGLVILTAAMCRRRRLV